MRAVRKWAEGGVAWGGVRGAKLPLPDFIVLPDLVARGRESLRFSMDYAPGGRLEPLGGYAPAPLYLAVQDGITPGEVAVAAHGLIGGLFVGGSLEWKLRTAERWCEVAHGLGWKCHVGRVGTVDRLRWARRIGADSVDSCVPLWSDANLERFCVGLDDDRQLSLVA